MRNLEHFLCLLENGKEEEVYRFLEEVACLKEQLHRD